MDLNMREIDRLTCVDDDGQLHTLIRSQATVSSGPGGQGVPGLSLLHLLDGEPVSDRGDGVYLIVRRGKTIRRVDPA